MQIDKKEIIDAELMKFYQQTDFNEYLSAYSKNKISGLFLIESLDIEINISEEEEELILLALDFLHKKKDDESLLATPRVKKAINIYKQYFQARNHELAHLYQVFALPTFQMYWISKTNTLRLEAAVMLSFFDNGGSYYIKKHRKLLDIIEDKNIANEDNFITEFNEDLKVAQLYIGNYKTTYEGLSIHYLIESMAHVISLYLSDEPEQDNLEIESNEVYSYAYRYFSNFFKASELEARWRHLIFTYFCYFSLHYISSSEERDWFTPIKIFISLCKNSKRYIKFLKKSKNKYQNLNIINIEINQAFGISDIDISFATGEQKSSILSFFELIDKIEHDVINTERLDPHINNDKLDTLYQWSQENGVDWKNKYTLVKMLIFPSNYQWIEDMYSRIMSDNENQDENSFNVEADFYKFIRKCRAVLDNSSGKIECCDKHGYIDNKKILIKCAQSNGFSFYLKNITRRNSSELFKY